MRKSFLVLKRLRKKVAEIDRDLATIIVATIGLNMFAGGLAIPDVFETWDPVGLAVAGAGVLIVIGVFISIFIPLLRHSKRH